MATPAQMVEENKKLIYSLHAVDTLITFFPPSLMTPDRLNNYNVELKEIRDKYLEFSTQVLTFSMSFLNTADPPKTAAGVAMDVSWWKETDKDLQARVNAHQLEIRKIASDLHTNRGMSEFERQDLDIKRKQLELQEKLEKKTQDEEKSKANATAYVKYDEILALGCEMDEFLDEVIDWDKATRAEVISAMKNLDKWSDKFGKLNKAYREFNYATSKYMIADLSDKVEDLMEDTTNRYKKLVEQVREQDNKRELYSLAGSNSEQVSLPKFSGSFGEDFFTFKKKLISAFEKNRVPVADKVEKLRTCLSGEALTLVPEKTKEFSGALDNLEKAYGNSEKVLQSRLADIKKLGKCPAEIQNGKRNFAGVVSFCLKVEVLIQDLLDLAEQEGCEHLQYDVYGTSVRQSIQQLFNLREEKKMRNLTGRGKSGLLEHVDLIAKIRANAQSMVDPVGVSDVKQEKKDQKVPHKSISDKSPGLVNFSKTKKFEECRICVVLETEGKTELFVNHGSNFVTGCPQFQAMSYEERKDICFKAKICLKCCDPKVIHSQRHRFDCKVTKKQKFWFTCCKHPDCLQHAWMCGYHKAENKSRLEEFSKKKNLTTPVNVNVSDGSVTDSHDASAQPAVTDGGAKAIKNMKRNLKKKGIEVVDVPEGNSLFMLAPLEGATRSLMGFFDSGCSDSVLRHGVPGLELHGVCTNKGPIPMQGVGGIVVHAREEWTVKLRRKDSRVQLVRGFTMDRVCAAMPMVNTEQAVAEIKNSDLENLKLQNCKVPAEVGGEVDLIIGCRYNIISPTPIHTLEGGLIIYDIPLKTHNSVYNACIGGPHQSFSILLNHLGGISRVHHTLQILHSALDSYKKYGPPRISNFHPSSKEMDYAKAFFASEFELEHVPGIDTFEEDFDDENSMSESEELPAQPNTFEIFPPSLNSSSNTSAGVGGRWRCLLGPHGDSTDTSLHSMRRERGRENEEETQNAPEDRNKEVQADNGEVFGKDLHEAQAIEEPEETQCDDTVTERNEDLLGQRIISIADLPCLCSTCYHTIVSDDDKLRELKHWCKQMEGGLSQEYRCPACRECLKCRDPDTTDKISLRMEVEQKQIEDSVTLDFENKRILVTLPKRGSEELFLTSNRDIALKVLNGICTKASKSDGMKLQISKAFEKLFANDHAVFVEDLGKEDLDKFVNKVVQYYLPWRVVWKLDSLTTPLRPVFDASTNTRRRADGSGGGRSLNDLLCKGRVDTLNLLRMVVRFLIGTYALCGDLQQFYCCCRLVPEEYNLVRFLYKPDMSPDSEPKEAVFKGLSFGLKSASGQSECSKQKLADHNEEDYPEVATMIREGYVDDMGESKQSSEEITKLMNDADTVFAQVNLKCKDWNRSGIKPSQISSADGASIYHGGFQFFPEVDAVYVKIPFLHFGKRRRGKVDENVEYFNSTGDLNDKERLDKFCPDLTRRICASKSAAVFDITGLLAPVLSGVKCLMRETVRATKDWDEKLPVSLRNKWLDAFLTLEKLRGIGFDRPVMPADAVSKDLRLIQLSDAAEPCTMVGVWGGFELPNGNFSCRLIIGRSLLSADTTIPKLELDGANGAANLGWFIRSALKDWPVSVLQGCDSTIALCWITSEHLRLSLFHRNRVVQIRRALELENLYHVRTDVMVADCGTRPDKVSVKDVLVGSRWHNGEDWMSWPVQKAIDEGCIKPALDLRLNDIEKEEFKDGVIFERVPELLTRGHVINETRVSEIEKRARFSGYVVVPTKFGLKKSIRVMVLVVKFLIKCRRGKAFTGRLLSNPLGKIPALLAVSDCLTVATTTEQLSLEELHLEERSFMLVVTYLFRVTSAEVKEFNSKGLVDKHGIEQDGIIYSKSRLLEEMEFKQVTGMEMVHLDPLGVNVKAPLIDRFSPLAYSIAQYIHWKVAKHAGMEMCHRLCLERVHILQGFSLLRELALECPMCKIKRKRFLEVSTGPAGEHQFTIAPPMYACQADLFGPVIVYAPGYSKDLRGRPARACKVWVMVFVCPVTRLVSCQVIEKSDNSGMIDGVTRLASDYGFPKYLMVDQDGAIMKALQEAKVNMRDLQHNLHSEHGVVFTTCPVGGHNAHGHVERIIKSIQEMLDDCGVKNKRLHATGLQTFLKLVENNYNSLPLGYSYDRSSSNTPLLKIITPNFFKMGRNNNRALEGPVKMPGDGGELLKKINETYEAMFRLWSETYVPRLIYQPSKWNKDDHELNVGDLVYFKKSPDNKLGSKWIIGMVEELMKSRDGKVRRVLVKYQNSSEDQTRLTDRAIRSLVKIFDVEEYVLQEDLEEMLNRLVNSEEAPVDDDDAGQANISPNTSAGVGGGGGASLGPHGDGTDTSLHSMRRERGTADELQPATQSPLAADENASWLSSPWLQHTISQECLNPNQHSVQEEMNGNQFELTFEESDSIATIYASRILENVGIAVETAIPGWLSACLGASTVQTVHEGVPDVGQEQEHPSGSDGFIQMIRRTDLILE